jgi:hypothetical protein
MSDLTKKSPAQLRAEIAEREAANERDRVALAAMEAEPDYEAWRPALEAYCKGGDWNDASNPMDALDERRIRGLIAALPLAPAEPVDFDVEALARLSRDQFPRSPYDAALFAIRATLNRDAWWPGGDHPRCEGMAQNCAHYKGGCDQCRKPLGDPA